MLLHVMSCLFHALANRHTGQFFIAYDGTL